jgi:Cu/Zn superoxide dismutase
VDDPNGVGATTVNGVNDKGDLVGFYTDAAGNTDGMLAVPAETRPIVEHLDLQSMPAGNVTLSRNSDGTLAAHLAVTGLTPGSAHDVEIDVPGGSRPAIQFGSFTADGTGDANVTVDSAPISDSDSAPASASTSDSASADLAAGRLPSGARLVIRLGHSTDGGTGGGDDALAYEPIAQTEGLQSRLDADGTRFDLHAVDVDANGNNQGQLNGHATVTYDPAAQTIKVTLDASGLTPGMHAAHIHSGSCQAQGPVLYMLMDFQADQHGDVVDQTRTVTGVSSMPAAASWYLNLHQGDSNDILADGAPTLNFRPLLCANG